MNNFNSPDLLLAEYSPVESVERSWARTIWNVDQFSEHLINAGFDLRSVDESHGELIQVFASVAT